MSWGSGTFTELMNNPLPGTYININVTSTISRLSGERGYLACPVELNWGTDGDVIVVEASKYETQALELFGVPAGSPELVYIEEMLKHASVLYLYRINSGTKAVGVLGEAQCTGETGNLITVVVEEDPDNPGDDQPDTTAAIVKGVGQTYTVAYKNLYKQGVAIKVKRAGVVVEQSGNYTVKKTGEDTYTVTMLDTAWPGAYTIEACTGDSDEPLATYGFGLTYPDPTARIERNLNVFTVEYQKLFDKYTASTKLYKGDGTEVDQANNWTISGETDTFTVTILQTIDPGTYRLQAEVDNGTVLAVFTFVIPEPTAKIDVTKENDQYYIEYKDLGGYSADVVIKNEQGDVPKGTKYTVTGQDDVFMVDINDQLEGGTYTLEARVKKSEVSKVLESVTVIIPRPTAEITVTQEGKEYQAVFQNLRAETGALKVKKDGQDVSENVEVTGDNPIVAKIGYDLIDDGDYTVEASSTNEELLDSESFSVPTPTGSIAVNTEGKSYTANFNDLRKKHTGSVKFTKDGEDDSNVQTSGENPIEVTVDYDSLGDGNYKLEAFATGVEAALDSKEFTVKTPTAVISEGTENVKYTILYSDLGANQVHSLVDGLGGDEHDYRQVILFAKALIVVHVFFEGEVRDDDAVDTHFLATLVLNKHWNKKIPQLEYSYIAKKCKKSFEKYFYNSEKKCLYDVIGDDKIRPNQLYAIGLSYPILDCDKEQAKNSFVTVTEKLLNNYGLMTLAKGEEGFSPKYEGGPYERDLVYHQGTTWPYLLGIYYDALKNLIKAEEDPKIKKTLNNTLSNFKLNVANVYTNEIINGNTIRKYM